MAQDKTPEQPLAKRSLATSTITHLAETATIAQAIKVSIEAKKPKK